MSSRPNYGTAPGKIPNVRSWYCVDINVLFKFLSLPTEGTDQTTTWGGNKGDWAVVERPR